MIALLNQQLADRFDLYSQTKQAYWNVKARGSFLSTICKANMDGKLNRWNTNPIGS